MCGRYVLSTPGDALAELFRLDPTPDLPARYNIAPSQEVAVVVERAPGAARELARMRWGLVPRWAKEEAIGERMINARAETAAEKPSFRDSVKRRRCLILADGFYEWQKVAGGKQPWWIGLEGRRPFAFAGLWASWKRPEGGELESCAILTTAANDFVRPIHDRMPVILAREAHSTWLDPRPTEGAALAPLLVPYPAATMRAFPVSKRVNNPSYDAPDCLAPLAAG
ncbi:MAG: SOS response-associated peptidase [Thermoanaerobaculia bacterium]